MIAGIKWSTFLKEHLMNSSLQLEWWVVIFELWQRHIDELYTRKLDINREWHKHSGGESLCNILWYITILQYICIYIFYVSNLHLVSEIWKKTGDRLVLYQQPASNVCSESCLFIYSLIRYFLSQVSNLHSMYYMCIIFCVLIFFSYITSSLLPACH